MATGGLAFMLLSMVSSILLISDYLLNIWVAAIITVIAASWFLTFWAAIPFLRHNWIDEDAEEEAEESTGRDVEGGREITGTEQA